MDRDRLVDVTLAVVVGAVQVAGVALAGQHQTDREPFDLLGALLLGGAAVALVVRRRHPAVTYVVAFILTMAYTATGQPYGPAFLALVIAFFTVYLRGLRALALGGLVSGYIWSLWLAPLVADQAHTPWFAAAVGAWLLVLATAAELTRIRRERVAEAARVRDEEARRRASDERLAIARELHDVLAHDISLISVQAGVALHLLDQRPEQARPALTAIRDASREALGQLRSTLDVLRQGEAAPRAPTAGMRDLDAVVERTRATGLTVDLRVSGPVHPLPADVDLAALRIVQEALTNVVRHADARRAAVRVDHRDGAITLQIDDDGRGPNGAGPGMGPGASDVPGRGLVGMRERAVALGGSFEAGPRPGRGFRVRATLPTDRGGEASGAPDEAPA